ncbi:ROK family transcriptional regulator [Naasia aerilata]|uniref:ROK family transcriptional regulator n=1 Tax=Naasia aerilata TaxID=1162966 RepID=UPI00257477F5|nr:ROK family transcriptional regulator [Naasia aerilata]
MALEVLIHGPISRSDIARRLNLSAGSLSRLSAGLLQSGVLVETGELSEGRAGRPSRPLDVVPGSRHFLGMKLTGEELLGVVTDLRANVLDSSSVVLPSRDPESVVETVARLAERLSRSVASITALGVGLGGRVDRRSVVLSAPFLEWTDVRFGEMLERRTGLRTVVENDVDAFTEYEHWFGSGRGLDRFAVLTLGVGIGYGAVLHDRLLSNRDSGLGLVGHWPLDPYGPLCPQGHRGCARSVLASPAIAQAIGTALGRPIDFDEACRLAEAGDPIARRVMDDAGRGLGRLIAAVGNLTLPDRIVLGGEGVRLASIARAAVEEGIAIDRDPRATRLDIVATSGDNIEWCRGAAVIAIQDFVLDSTAGRL